MNNFKDELKAYVDQKLDEAQSWKHSYNIEDAERILKNALRRLDRVPEDDLPEFSEGLSKELDGLMNFHLVK